MRKKRMASAALAVVAASCFALAACSEGATGLGGNDPGRTAPSTDFDPAPVVKTLSKSEYVNKTLGGLLGQFAGFLSGYEFVWRGPDPYIGMPDDWFEFLNGPYAGNFEYFTPPDGYRYDRLRINPDTGRNEVWSDDDYHIDIFNQLILDEYGASSYAIKEAWKKYNVGDWGGGGDAMMLINSSEMLAPYTGTIEAGNRYGWCTEAYIENETLGMNAPGMPNTATALVDTFASNVGYFDSVVWAKFYAAMYSLAYFETDIVEVMEKAKDALPKGSYPRQMYDMAFDEYNANKNDYVTAAKNIERKRRMLYRLDNVQTDPDINGAFAVLSWLYGNNSYMETCKISSLIGYDGDCTAAICVGVMGILNGFKQGNEEYEALNREIYYDGEGVYYNDDGSLYDGEAYAARIKSKDYPARQKIDDIVALYQKNFEKILLQNGGTVDGDNYKIPTTALVADHSFLFDNYDAEKRDTTGFSAKNGTLECLVESENGNSHTGYGAFRFTNTKEGETYHTFTGLATGKAYRLSVYVKTDNETQVNMFARGGGKTSDISFASVTSLINKEFIFTATHGTMEVGFKFPASAARGETVIFDDFMLEEIEREELSVPSDQNLKLSSDRFMKNVKKPDGIKAGEQVVISVEYRNYVGNSIPVGITRNGNMFGSVIASNTSKNSLSGKAYLEIPYVFEKDSDVIQLNFNGYKLHIGGIKVYRSAQYMFR